MTKVAVVGTGVMGETLLAGLLRAGWAPADVVAAERRDARRHEIASRYGVHVADTKEAVSQAETVLLVVKPQDVPDVLAEIGGALAPGALVVSLCAGVTCRQIETLLPAGQPVVRVMPNTPAQVDEGMSAISPGQSADESHLARVSAILSAVGKVITVPESYQDAVTAVSGSGPAYVFLVVEAMVDAGVMLGLPRDVATTLVVQTVFGSAKLLVDSGEHPTVLRERVTSPGGTTAAALRELEDHGVKSAFMSAMEAARDRSKALSAAMGSSSH